MILETKVQGDALLNQFLDNEFLQELRAILSKSPSESLQRIAEQFGEYPNTDGNNIPGIVQLRDLLYWKDTSGKFANALVITAPHTHWQFAAPTIIDKIDDVYLIGPKIPTDNLEYNPVSFLLNGTSVIPYEWAAPSVGLREPDLEHCIQIIQELAREMDTGAGYFGISLNFRFKSLFAPEFVPNIENPAGELIQDYLELSIIQRIHEHLDSKSELSSEQVSWHFFSDLLYDLSIEEKEILDLMRDLKSRS